MKRKTLISGLRRSVYRDFPGPVRERGDSLSILQHRLGNGQHVRNGRFQSDAVQMRPSDVARIAHGERQLILLPREERLRKKLRHGDSPVVRGRLREQSGPNPLAHVRKQHVQPVARTISIAPVPVTAYRKVASLEQSDRGGRVNVEAVAQPGCQAHESGELRFRRVFLRVEVADHAHADVVRVRRRVSPGIFDRAALVDRAVAADQEVVADVTPALAHVVALDALNLLHVFLRVRRIRAERQAGVMHGDGDRAVERALRVRVERLILVELAFLHRTPLKLGHDVRRGRPRDYWRCCCSQGQK